MRQSEYMFWHWNSQSYMLVICLMLILHLSGIYLKLHAVSQKINVNSYSYNEETLKLIQLLSFSHITLKNKEDKMGIYLLWNHCLFIKIIKI